jgi:4-amino-4-deoxy-L-arabinose transferase-like glycosyltransferase
MFPTRLSTHFPSRRPIMQEPMVVEPETVVENVEEEHAPRQRHGFPALWWGLSSLGIRLIAWLWAVSHAIKPTFDEGFYLERAQGYADLLARHGSASDAWSTAYGHGIWPPLHPFLLGIASLIGPNPLASARLLGVLLSALTTVLIYALTARLASRRAAAIGAGIHAFYPTLIAFSHLLFSETLFIALLVGATLSFVRCIRDERLGFGLVCGLLLGLMTITRASAVFYPIVFLLAAILAPGPKLKRAGLLLVPVLLLAVPWLVVLRSEEGRPVFFATGNGYNFYLGNNPSIRPWHGSAWADYSVLPTLQRQMIADTGVAHMAYWDEAGRRRAWAFIREEPGAAVERAAIRAVETWHPDWYVPQYFRRGVYPAEPWAGAVVFLGTFGHFLILALGIYGLFFIRSRGLLAALVVAGMVGPVLTIASSRFGLPMLTLLIVPAAVAMDLLVSMARGHRH